MTTASNSLEPDRFTAGFKLLDKFQRQWQQIHSSSQINVNKANLVLDRLDSVERSCARRLQALDNLATAQRTLSKLDGHMQSIHSDLRNLENSFTQIEELLLVLKSHKERADGQQYMDTMERQCDGRVGELVRLSDARKEKLRADHLQRVGAFEEEQQRELEERRALLARAFEEEKSRYLNLKSGPP